MFSEAFLGRHAFAKGPFDDLGSVSLVVVCEAGEEQAENGHSSCKRVDEGVDGGQR